MLLYRSDKVAVLLEIGTRAPETDGFDYPDIDLILREGEEGYRHRDGTPYEVAGGRRR